VLVSDSEREKIQTMRLAVLAQWPTSTGEWWSGSGGTDI